jgi:hypothetical protein
MMASQVNATRLVGAAVVAPNMTTHDVSVQNEVHHTGLYG